MAVKLTERIKEKQERFEEKEKQKECKNKIPQCHRWNADCQTGGRTNEQIDGPMK